MKIESTLSREFCTALGRDEVPDARVDAALQELWEKGRARWPGIELDQTSWARHLGHGVQRRFDEYPDALSTLRGLHAEDFYLACACMLALPEAIAAFDRSHLSQLPVLLSHLRPAPSFVDEVGQVLRERLLVGHDGSPPKIAAYAGDGPLLAWVRTAAVRTALNLMESRDFQVARDGATAEDLASRDNPEAQLIGRQQQAELLGILRQAFCELPPLQRRALRLHFAETLTGDEIAARLGVHRATVVRWLATARQSLLKETERLFRLRLDLSAHEVQSVVVDTQDRLAVSLSMLLRTVPVDGPSR